MDPFIYAFAVALALGVIATLTFALLWKSAQKALVEERASHAATSQNLVATQAAVQLSEGGRSSETARLEAIIAAQKAEIIELEAVKLADPAAARARLEKLSGG